MRSPRLATSIKAIVVIGATCAATLFAVAPAANAATGGCSYAGFNRPIPVVGSNGTVNVSEHAYYCNAYQSNQLLKVVPGAPPPEYNGALLNAGRSWFTCQYNWVNVGGSVGAYGNPPVGNARNNWWLFTYADSAPTGVSRWGWFPATKISGGGNYAPEPGLPACDSLNIYPASTF